MEMRSSKNDCQIALEEYRERGSSASGERKAVLVGIVIGDLTGAIC